jgi:hypothetical protein
MTCNPWHKQSSDSVDSLSFSLLFHPTSEKQDYSQPQEQRRSFAFCNPRKPTGEDSTKQSVSAAHGAAQLFPSTAVPSTKILGYAHASS